MILCDDVHGVGFILLWHASGSIGLDLDLSPRLLLAHEEERIQDITPSPLLSVVPVWTCEEGASQPASLPRCCA